MSKKKITNIATFLFVLWFLAYVLHDLHVISYNMDIIPLPIVIILYLAVVVGSQKIKEK